MSGLRWRVSVSVYPLRHEGWAVAVTSGYLPRFDVALRRTKRGAEEVARGIRAALRLGGAHRARSAP